MAEISTCQMLMAQMVQSLVALPLLAGLPTRVCKGWADATSMHELENPIFLSIAGRSARALWIILISISSLSVHDWPK